MEEKQITVLVIDDDNFFADVVCHKLKAEGMESEYAPTGTIAFSLLETKTPSCILLDVMMPDMSGLEVLKKIKAEPRWAKIPVVMFSNDATDGNIGESKTLGADVFLEKVNVDLGRVASTIRSLVEK